MSAKGVPIFQTLGSGLWRKQNGTFGIRIMENLSITVFSPLNAFAGVSFVREKIKTKGEKRTRFYLRGSSGGGLFKTRLGDKPKPKPKP